MSQSGGDDFFAPFAGRTEWPHSARDLADTTLCPACQAPLTGPVCSQCSLDLRHPAAAALLTASTDAAAAFTRRVTLIGQIRYETAQARVQADATAQEEQRVRAQQEQRVRAQAAAQAQAQAVQAAAQAAQTERAAVTGNALPLQETPRAQTAANAAGPSPAAPAPAVPAPGDPAAPRVALPPAPPARPKRSSVQVLLLIVGVVLVSVAAIFFLTVAFYFAGLGVRSLVIGAVTAAIIATAAVLRRKGLVATAEGIGALGVVLVLLDAWALRANNLAGLASADGLLYWGIALSVCAGLFLGWHALSRLRVASVAGFLAVAPGLGLVTAGLAADLDPLSRVYLACLAAALGTLIHRATLPRATGFWPVINRVPERLSLLVLTAVALVGASVTALFATPESTLAPLWYLGGVAAVTGLHLAAVGALQQTDAVYRVFAHGYAVLTAAAIVTIAPQIAVRAESFPLLLTLPLLVAAALALGLEFALARLSAGLRPTARTGAITAALLAAPLGFATVAFGAWPLATALFSGITANGSPVAEPTADNLWALGALVTLGALTALAWTLGGRVPARRALLLGFGLGVLVLAIAFLGSLGLVLGAYLGLAVMTLAVLLRTTRPSGENLPLWMRPQLIVLVAVAGGLGFQISWASSATWWIGTAVAILLAFGARLLCGRESGATGRAALLGIAVVLTLIAAGTAPAALTLGWNLDFDGRLMNILGGLTLATGLLQLWIALPSRSPGTGDSGTAGPANPMGARLTGGLDRRERRWAFWILLLPTGVVFAVPGVGSSAVLLQPQPTAFLVHCTVLLAAALLWALLPANRVSLALERIVAAVGLAPVLALLLDAVLQATDAPGSMRMLALPAAALLVAALALTRGLGARVPAAQATARARVAQASDAQASAMQASHDSGGNNSNSTEPRRADPSGSAPSGSAPSGSAPRTGAPGGPNLSAGYPATPVAPAARDRIGFEVGAAIVLVPAVLAAVVGGHPLAWLAVVVAALTVLVVAVSPDGLFGSVSPRRHLGWAALLLAVGGLWLGLDRAGTEALEPYVLPVAAALLVLAALIRRFGRVDRVQAASSVAGVLVLAGLLVAILPLALIAGTGSLLRPLVVGAVSAVLLLAGSALAWTAARRPYLAATALAGALGVLLVAGLRLRVLLLTPNVPDARLEAWLLPACAVAVTAAILLLRQTDAPSRRVRLAAANALVVLVLFLATAAITVGLGTFSAVGRGAARQLEWVSFASALATGRALVLVLALATVHALTLRRLPLVAWVALTLGALAGFAGWSAGALDPIEVVSAPLGVAVIVGQLRTGARKAWILGGLAAVLLPSALASGDGPLLRPILVLAAAGALALGASVVGASQVGVSGSAPSTLAVRVAAFMRRAGGAALAGPAVGLALGAVVLTAGGRIVPLYRTPAGATGQLEAWLLPAVLIACLSATAMILTARRDALREAASPTEVAERAGTVSNRIRLGYAVLSVTAVLTVITEVPALAFDALASARVITLVAVFAAVHVAVFALDRSRPGRRLGWTILGAATIMALAGLARSLPDPVELVSVTLGLAVVLGQILNAASARASATSPVPTATRTADDAGGSRALTARNRAWIVAGLAVGLLPSAVLSGDGALLRPVLVLLAAGVLALTVSTLSGSAALQRDGRGAVLVPAVALALIAVLLAARGRIAPLLQTPLGANAQLEAWLIPAVLIAVLTSAALIRTGRSDAARDYKAPDPATARAATGSPTTSTPIPAALGTPRPDTATLGAAAPGTATLGSATLGAAAPGTATLGAAAPNAASVVGRIGLGYGVLIATAVFVVAAEVPALASDSLAAARVVTVVLAFAAAHVACFELERNGAGRRLGLFFVAAAALMIMAGQARSVPEAIELLTVPLALALLTTGALHLGRVPRARSWPWLAPGIVLLLVPSLVLDVTDGTLWRIVMLGVLATAVVVVGVTRRLQAPFVIGSVVLLIHATAQLWPWIALAYGAVAWWLWLGIGGVLLIVLAARYEKRIQNLKAVALSISALR